MSEITKICPFCGTVTTISATETQIRLYNVPRRERLNIIEIFPLKDSTERETLINGVCKSCQDDIYGKDEE